jgi:GAF domain-containing protein/HAMP domain-containing protein
MVEGKIEVGTLSTTPLFDDPLFAPGNLVFVTNVPLRLTSRSEEPDALLIGINAKLRMGTLMNQMQIFWETRGEYRVERGDTYILVAPDVILRLAQYATEPEAATGQTHPIFAAAQIESSGTEEFTNLEGEQVLVSYEWLPEWDLGVIIERPQADIFTEVNTLATFMSLLLLGATILVILVVPLITRSVTRPLATLTEFAERIARGEWLHRVPQTRNDEIGRLSRTFNWMADELSELYYSLEKRVEARTRQIRTASEVARDAVAIREVEILLDDAVRLISDRFGFYNVSVFLIDTSGDYAVLRAASSEGGRRLLRRGHRLAVGKVGIVGYVTGTGKPRIASDVSTDTTHFANPELPETRSEIALPLRVGDEIIGALNVQSVDVNAFDNEDALVLQTMADQLAVAIENAGLVQEHTQLSIQRRKVIDIYNQLANIISYDQLLAEIPAAVREKFGYPLVVLGLVEGEEVVIRGASSTELSRVPKLGRSVVIGHGPLGQAVTLKTPIAFPGSATGEPWTSETSSIISPKTLAVPLISRGLVSGALAVESDNPDDAQEREVEILEMVANQVAVALENARLFEQTQQRLQQINALYRLHAADAWDQLVTSLEGRGRDTVVHFTSDSQLLERPSQGERLEVPLSVWGEVIGSLDIQSEQAEGWSEDDQAILQAVADEVAGALEQARLLDEVQRRATQLRIAAEIARDATGVLDVDTLLSRSISLIRDRFDFYHVSAYLIDEAGQHAVVQEAAGEASEQFLLDHHSFSVDSQSIVGNVTRTGKPYVAQDITDDPYYEANSLLPETHSVLNLPLRVGDQIIGALDMHHIRVDAFSDDDIAALEILADQLAVGIHNAWLFEETLKRAEGEEAVLNITGKIRARGDVDGMLQTAVSEMRETLGAKRASIQLRDELLPNNIEENESIEISDENPKT